MNSLRIFLKRLACMVSMVVFEVSKSRIMEPEEDIGSMLTKRKLTIYLQLYTLWGLLRK